MRMNLIAYRGILRLLMIVELVLFLLGAILVTNMHPLWLQQLVTVLFLILALTAVVYYIGVMRVQY